MEHPYSERFDDIYYALDEGLEESRYVFLDGNNLAGRLDTKQDFCIVENGFGTGLNFLAAWQLWREKGKPGHLTYVGVEKYPLPQEELSRILSYWDELGDIRDIFLSSYFQEKAVFQEEHITLHLLIGDTADILPRLGFKADAWFLDGFAPQKNPAMWSDTVFSSMAKWSNPGAGFATFTAAGFVKRGLRANGFEVHRRKGFGKKRHMICGIFSQ